MIKNNTEPTDTPTRSPILERGERPVMNFQERSNWISISCARSWLQASKDTPTDSSTKKKKKIRLLTDTDLPNFVEAAELTALVRDSASHRTGLHRSPFGGCRSTSCSS